MPIGPARPRPMPPAALELMRVLALGIDDQEDLAGEIAAIADVARRTGRFSEAEAMRAMARNHRIRALEGRGRLAALHDAFHGPAPE